MHKGSWWVSGILYHLNQNPDEHKGVRWMTTPEQQTRTGGGGGALRQTGTPRARRQPRSACTHAATFPGYREHRHVVRPTESIEDCFFSYPLHLTIRCSTEINLIWLKYNSGQFWKSFPKCTSHPSIYSVNKLLPAGWTTVQGWRCLFFHLPFFTGFSLNAPTTPRFITWL